MKHIFKLFNNNDRTSNMTLINKIHSHNTRKSKNLNILNINIFQSFWHVNHLAVNSLKIWSELPNNMRSEKRFKSFNRLLYDYLLNAYEI